MGVPQKKNSTLKQRENRAKCSALLAVVASRHRKGMWYMGGRVAPGERHFLGSGNQLLLLFVLG